MAESTPNRGLTFILINAAFMSFCGLGYQQLMAVVLSDSTGDYVLSQSASLGLFLLGMGLGSWRSDQRPATWRRLLAVEWGLALAGTLAVAYLHFAEIALRFFGLVHSGYLFAAAAPLIVLLGFLNGSEIPLLLRLGAGAKPGAVLGAGYLGAFAAAAVVPIFLLPALDSSGTGFVLGIVNFVAATLILPQTAPDWSRLAHLSFGLLLLLLTRVQPAFDLFHLQTVYFTPRYTNIASLFGNWGWWERVGSPVRIRSSYQWIDILPPEFTDGIQGKQDFQLYLDRKIQFSSGNSKRYHEGMVHGAVNLLGREPLRVLILGGGDGLLAAELLKSPALEHIDLVEIDPAMIRLAFGQKELSRLNAGALKDPRLQVHLNDAFQFVRSVSEHYDLVLADLPFPVNYDLSLLFTKEFYALTGKTLTADGVMVIDFPLPGGDGDGDNLPDLLATLKAAGFDLPFAFGAEDFFVAISRRQAPLKFDLEILAPKVSNQTLLNLISRREDVDRAVLSSGRVNSVLFPLRFMQGETWGAERPAQMIRHSDNGRFLPLFLERFADSWSNEVGLGSFQMPATLVQFWRENMNEPRDFTEQLLPGVEWPRFQWGVETRGDKVIPVFQWLDVKNPEALRAAWSKSYCMTDSSDWIGVNWAGDKSWVEFFARGANGILVRRYEKGEFKSEYPLDVDSWQKSQVGSVPPVPTNSRAADIQFRIQREFLTNPRTYARGADWERFYFP